MLTRSKKRKLPEIAGGYLLRPDEMNFSKRRHINSRLRQIEYLAQFIKVRRRK